MLFRSFKLDAAGWTAIGLPELPPGKTAHDVVSVVCDWASAFDPGGWHSCDGSVDYQGNRLVFHGDPGCSFTARIWVTD